MQKLIVVPARGGSKGIPGKNIYPLNGKPLLAYTLEVISAARLPDTDVVVSTDSAEIKKVALEHRNVYVVDRPECISGDHAKTEDALIHAVDAMQVRTGKKYDAVLTLQATSPMRRPETLVAFVREFEKNFPQYDAQLSLHENRADFWIMSMDGHYERLYKDAPRRRQDRKPLYIENSAYYITGITALRETMSVLGRNASGFLIREEEAVDINEPLDLVIAEAMVRRMEGKI